MNFFASICQCLRWRRWRLFRYRPTFLWSLSPPGRQRMPQLYNSSTQSKFSIRTPSYKKFHEFDILTDSSFNSFQFFMDQKSSSEHWVTSINDCYSLLTKVGVPPLLTTAKFKIDNHSATSLPLLSSDDEPHSGECHNYFLSEIV